MAEIKNRELAQFSSFLHVDNTNKNIGIASDATPYIGIGTVSPESKVHIVGDVKVAGVVTATTLDVANLSISNAVISSGSVTVLDGTSLYYSGIGTIVTLKGTSLNYTGVSTISGVTISSGIITSSNSGIVTYYGDGGKLLNITQSIGVSSDGNLIGYAVTTLNFTGPGLGTVTIPSSGITTIFIEGQSVAGSDTQVQYNSSGSFAASANFTFDGTNVSIAGTVSAANFNSTSDANLKENVETFENALDVVSQLRGVRFDWKETHYPSIGVIAQELEEVLPELVTNTDPKTVNYNGIIGVLIEAIKELKAEVEELKNTK